MAHSYRGVGILQQIADWASDDIASPENHSLLGFQVDSGLLQQYHHAFWRAWYEQRMAVLLCQLADVLDAKPIDVLLVSDCRRNSIFGDVFRKRELDKDAVNTRVMVKTSDTLQQLRFCDIFGVVFMPGEYIRLRSSTWIWRTALIKRFRTSSAAFNFMRIYVPKRSQLWPDVVSAANCDLT